MTRPTPFIDPADYPADQVVMSAEECKKRNPQRFEFLQLDAILHLSLEENLVVGHRVLHNDEFWVRGHLPGRPLFPGVMMCECLAQTASIHAHMELALPDDVFMGFGALDDVRFRSAVEPNTELWAAGRIIKASKRRPYFKWEGQLLRADASIVCEATITGVAF